MQVKFDRYWLDPFQKFIADQMRAVVPKDIWQHTHNLTTRAKEDLYSILCDKCCLSDSPDVRQAFRSLLAH